MISPGPWDPTRDFAGREVAALIVLEGLVMREVMVGSIASCELIGPGDAATFGVSEEAQLPQRVRWIVVADTRVAAVDFDTVASVPRIAARLLRGLSDQLRRGSVQNAIGHLPRVEERVLALMWHLAERWGRVGPEGTIVPLELTHDDIGRLVGARRPTVSLALKQLAADGTVQRSDRGGWLLAPGSAELMREQDKPALSKPQLA